VQSGGGIEWGCGTNPVADQHVHRKRQNIDERPGDEEAWTVELLIRAPKSATIDLDTMNGPISLYDVDGKLTARAKNGPISLKNFSGEADITAVNGPISLHGSNGSVRIHTENGPISVALTGRTWSGAGLTADAKNGPLTLMVPSGYQSSFVVESTNYAPVNCKASICDNARKTWDDEHRRIDMAAVRRRSGYRQ